MKFTGSLVVMDSRRWADSLTLDGTRGNGLSPFGVMGWHQSQGFHEDGLSPAPTAPDWGGIIPRVYTPPDRQFTFNEDLLTEAGTPPFTPFGVSAAGVGSWSRAFP